jgi:hypothetical protein
MISLFQHAFVALTLIAAGMPTPSVHDMAREAVREASVRDRLADVPTISTLAPTSSIVGAGSLALTVNGTNFTRTSVVRWNGVERATTFVSANQLRADILGADLAALLVAQITVVTRGGGGGTSNAVAFTVGNPLPIITRITPDSVAPLAPALTLQVDGTNFAAGASAYRNGSLRPSTYLGPTRLLVSIPASDLSTTGTSQITVYNPAPLGGSSAPKSFRVAAPVPRITDFSPRTRPVGMGQGFRLIVTGTNFPPNAVVRWNGQDRPTLGTGTTSREADIPDSDVDTAGNALVTVRGTPAGSSVLESAPVTLSLPNPNPTIVFVMPTYLIRGAAPTYGKIEGTGFNYLSVVTINGRDANFQRHGIWNLLLGSPQAQSSDTIGPATLAVSNPPPGGGSVTRVISIVDAPPTLTSLAPQTVYRAGTAFTLVVKGDRFYPGMKVHWQGTERTTTFISRTELRAAINATDLRTVGGATVKVVGPFFASTNTLNVAIVDQMIIIK